MKTMKTMKKVKTFGVSLAVLMLFVINLAMVGAQGEPIPHSFYGTVQLNGADVEDGTLISAWINGEKKAEVPSQTFNGDSVYSMSVPDGPEEATIEFRVDGNTANETATWQEGGNVELNLTAADDGPQLPVAAFSANPTNGQAPLTVNYTDESSGNINSWLWDLGDGTTSTDQNPSHVYAANGEYTVTLTVDGPDGSDTETRANYIVVSDLGNVVVPLASAGDLSVEPESVIFPQTALGGEDVLAYAIDEAWRVSDTTQLGAGWHVAMIAQDHLRGVGDPLNRVIEVGADHEFKVNCLDDEITPVSGDPDKLPTCSVGTQPVPISGENPLSLLSAAAYDGMGVYDFIPHFQLLIRGSTVIDTYTTNIFVDATAGP